MNALPRCASMRATRYRFDSLTRRAHNPTPAVIFSGTSTVPIRA